MSRVQAAALFVTSPHTKKTHINAQVERDVPVPHMRAAATHTLEMIVIVLKVCCCAVQLDPVCAAKCIRINQLLATYVRERWVPWIELYL